MKRMLYPFLLLAAAILFFQSANAQRTIRMNIERMVSDAALIVHGTVTNVESSADPQTHIIATSVTIAVLENFYGADQSTVTVKMVGGKTSKKTVKFAEMPAFKVGEEIYSLFFAPSKYGFTSPVGMCQGKFTVQTDAATNKKVVRNAVNNARLFSNMKNISAVSSSAISTTNESMLGAEDFSKTIRSLVTVLKK